MPQPDGHNSGANQKDRKSMLTLLVLTATLGAVICYTRVAQGQVKAMHNAVTERPRPILDVIIDPTGFSTAWPAIPEPVINVPFTVFSSGKLAAKAIIGSGAFYMKDGSTSPSADKFRNLAQQTEFIAPEGSENFHALGNEALAAGTVLDIQSGNGVVFVSIRIAYGRHHTNVCKMYRIVAANNPPQGDKAPARLEYGGPCAGAADLNDAN
ncbi:MAG: hypothetical protein WA005_15305 [Candidatus Binataceae bacterium]